MMLGRPPGQRQSQGKREVKGRPPAQAPALAARACWLCLGSGGIVFIYFSLFLAFILIKRVTANSSARFVEKSSSFLLLSAPHPPILSLEATVSPPLTSCFGFCLCASGTASWSLSPSALRVDASFWKLRVFLFPAPPPLHPCPHLCPRSLHTVLGWRPPAVLVMKGVDSRATRLGSSPPSSTYKPCGA